MEPNMGFNQRPILLVWRKISNGIVTELNLSGNLLEGNFPASVFSLTNLKN
jgi:hypothetical protein